MSAGSPQILLPLEPHRDDRLHDFVPGANAAVLDSLKALLNEASASIFLSGPASSGKTHLLNGLCHRARESGLQAFYLPLKRLPAEAAGILDGLEHLQLVCVDDIQAVGGQRPWEEALFHLFNRIRDEGGRLVLASRDKPRDLAIDLPDLRSRLGWGTQLQLKPLSDEDKMQVLNQAAARAGVELPEAVGRYLLSRSSRDLRGLLDILDQLQQAAFAAKRSITVPLARSVLQAIRAAPV